MSNCVSAGCKEYIGSSQFIGSSLVVLHSSADPLVGWGGDEIWSVDESLKSLPPNVRF